MSDIQYRHELKKYIYITILLALIAQTVSIVSKLKLSNLSLFDYYILNTVDGQFIEYMIGWILPIYIGILCGKQFLFFKKIRRSLFTRTSKRQFILKRALTSFLIGYLFTGLFYLSALLFCFLTIYTMNAQIRYGVSIPLDEVFNPALYFSHPLYFLCRSIHLIALFAGVFSLFGFLVSLLTDNKIMILFSPLILMTLWILISEGLPYGTMINYNNFIILNISFHNGVAKNLYRYSGYITALIMILTQAVIITVISGKDEI